MINRIHLYVLVLLLGCGPGKPTREYVQDIENWKTKRLTSLKAEKGYVNLAGLFWLKKGDNTFGGSEQNNLKFPQEKSPESLGIFLVQDDSVLLIPDNETEINISDKKIIGSILAYHDSLEIIPEFNFGSLRWTVIKRGDQFGVRLRDLEHPNLTDMDPIEYFDLDPSMKVVADFEAYDPPKMVRTSNVLGMVYDAKVPGVLQFELQGSKLQMEPNFDGDRLHLRFRDETTGVETYGLGRYLHIEMPDSSNKVVVDFNKAYNPPCAFTEYATCPIPPKENHIPFKMMVGEKNYGEY